MVVMAILPGTDSGQGRRMRMCPLDVIRRIEPPIKENSRAEIGLTLIRQKLITAHNVLAVS